MTVNLSLGGRLSRSLALATVTSLLPAAGPPGHGPERLQDSEAGQGAPAWQYAQAPPIGDSRAVPAAHMQKLLSFGMANVLL